MCRHTYHHYPVCGHISSFTVSACPEFTNQLRMFASTGQSLVCEEVKMTHDLLSASQPSACVECERKWREMVTRGSPDAIRSRANSTIEGLATTSPIFQVAVRMTLDEENDSLPTEDVECGDERCDIYLDIAREHDRPCDCCGPAQPSQEDVIVIQIATLEGTTGREQSASNATDDPSVIAQPRPVVPDSVIRSSLFTYVSKWLEEVEDCHEQDEEPLDLLGRFPRGLGLFPGDSTSLLIPTIGQLTRWTSQTLMSHSSPTQNVVQESICWKISLLVESSSPISARR
ncbi:hypothetical protein N7492_010428 [Penicillium capsulatum]|uniref:Uncharacterized protein n=1 Tax=Penicillium capsulatum TaxID=69766 RepID=A0A9W9HL88_9EURO|nr:hypothetical protein N7492_010428 [Penicillium capsulatum]